MSSAIRRSAASIAVGCALAASLLTSLATKARSAEPLPDPTQPPPAALAPVAVPEEKAKTELALSAVFLAEDRRLAVIDGRRVGVSDVVAGARVLSIEPGRVRLKRAGEIVELELVSPAFRDARARGQRPKPATASRDASPSDPQGAAR